MSGAQEYGGLGEGGCQRPSRSSPPPLLQCLLFYLFTVFTYSIFYLLSLARQCIYPHRAYKGLRFFHSLEYSGNVM